MSTTDVTLIGSIHNILKYGYILPEWPLAKVWLHISGFFVFCTCILEPYIFAVDTTFVKWYTVYVLDVLFLLDVYLLFYTAYQDHGAWITNKRLIYRRYTSSEKSKFKFLYDVLSLLPLEILSPLFICRTIAWAGLRLNRLIRLYRLPVLLKMRADDVGANKSINKILRYLVCGTFFTHYVSCIWYRLACTPLVANQAVSCGYDSWVYQKSLDVGKTRAIDRYVNSLYWSASMLTSTGFGDVTARNTQEVWFSISVMLLGAFVFYCLLFGSVTSQLINAGSPKANYLNNLITVKQQMADTGLPKVVQQLVIDYYNFLWLNRKGVKPSAVFDMVPVSFQAELATSSNKIAIEQSQFLKGIHEGFQRMLSVVIRHEVCVPSQLIVTRGLGQKMVYIIRGRAQVLSNKDDATPVATLGQGDVFGEITIILPCRSKASVRAMTHCELFVINKEDIAKVLRIYPEVHTHLRDLAIQKCVQVFDHCEAEEKLDNSEISYKQHSKFSFDVANMAGIDKETLEITDRAAAAKSLDFTVIKTTEGVKKGIIDPGSRFSSIWNKCMFIVILAAVFLNTFTAFYASHTNRYIYQKPNGFILLIVSYCFDIFLWADIIVQLRTAVATPHGAIFSRKVIAKHYLGSFAFVLDLFAVLPVELVCFIVPSNKMYMFWSLAKLNRVIKLWKIWIYFDQLEQKLNISLKTICLLQFSVYILLLTHVCACLYYFLGNYIPGMHDIMSWIYVSPSKHLWLTMTPREVRNLHMHQLDGQQSALDTSHTNMPVMYLMSIYWAVATTTRTGFGDLVAYTINTRVLSVVVMILGLFLHSYVLSAIAAVLTNTDSARVRFQTVLFGIREYMVDHGLNDHLQNCVVNYMTTLWHKYKALYNCSKMLRSILHFREERLIGQPRVVYADIPESLQQDIAVIDAEFLLSVPLFQELNLKFMKELLTRVKTYVFRPEEIVVYAGDLGSEMYCIRRGICEIVTQDLVEVLGEIGPGQSFRDMCLLVDDYSICTIRAVTYVELLVLRRKDMMQLVSQYPIINNQFQALKCSLPDLQAKMKQLGSRLNADTDARVRSFLDISVSKPDASVGASSFRTSSSPNTTDNLEEDNAFIRFFLLSTTYLPNSRFAVMWVSVQFVVAVLVCFCVPLQASVFHRSLCIWIIGYVLDVLIITNMYVKLHTCYYDNNNQLITHPVSTARHYFRTGFWIDFVSVVPFEIIPLFLSIFIHHNVSVLNIMAVCRINRLICCCCHLHLTFSFLEESMEHDCVLVRKIKFLLYSLIFVNLMACKMFGRACGPLLQLFSQDKPTAESCFRDYWMRRVNFTLEDESWYVNYVASLYWASSTVMSVGFGDIHAESLSDVGLTMAMMVAGSLFFAYAIGSLAASFTNADSIRVSYLTKTLVLRDFMQTEKMDPTLIKRVMGHYKHLWHHAKGIDAKYLFESLPPSMMGDVTLSLYDFVISKIPEFKETDLGFRKLLSTSVRPLYVMKGEYVVRKHDVGYEIYFIQRGTVAVVSEDSGRIYDTMTTGSFFGEIAVLYGTRRNASVRAEQNCDLFVLHKDALDSVLELYPNVKKQVYAIARKRREAATERSELFLQADRRSSFQLAGVSPEKYKRSLMAERQKKLHRRYIFNPESKLVRYTNVINFFVTLIACILTAYQAALQDHMLFVYIVNYVCEILIFLKVLLKNRTGTYDDDGDLITKYKAQKREYEKNRKYMIVEYIALAPIDILAMLIPPSGSLRILTYLRLIHLIRTPILMQFFRTWEGEMSSNLFRVRLYKYITLVIISSHFVACIWYVIGCPNGMDSCINSRWLVRSGLSHLKPIEAYMYSLSWAVSSLTSTGIGSLHAHSPGEMFYASIIMIAGKLMFAYILGHIASTLANMAVVRMRFNHRVKTVKSYLRELSFSSNLRHQVMKYISFLWDYDRGIDVKRIINELPFCLQVDIQMSLCGDVFSKVLLFEDAEDSFYRLLSLKVIQVPFLREQYIVHKGDIGREMYFIHKGKVLVIDDEEDPDNTIIAKLGPGEHFGEVALVSQRPRRASVKAVTDVQLLILTRQDCEEVFRYFPLVKKQMSDIAEEEYGDQEDDKDEGEGVIRSPSFDEEYHKSSTDSDFDENADV